MSSANTSGSQPPRGYNYVTGPAHMDTIFQAAGIDPNLYADLNSLQDFLVKQGGLNALMELFSDGEQRFGSVEGVGDPYAALVGPPEQRHGEFYEKMAAVRADALLHGGPMEDEIHRLERFVGQYLAGLVAKGKEILPQGRNMIAPSLDPISGRLVVDCAGYLWHSSHPQPVVLEYGPGLAGAKWIEPLIQGIEMGVLPYQYVGVSNGPFVNEFLVRTFEDRFDAHFGVPDSRQLLGTGMLFLPREDGMERASRALLAVPQPGRGTEVCDLMLLTAVHTADPGELERTIALSPQLLKPDGRLMLSAPLTTTRPGVTTLAQELAWAMQAGYVVEWQGQAATGDTQLGTATVSGFAVLYK